MPRDIEALDDETFALLDDATFLLYFIIGTVQELDKETQTVERLYDRLRSGWMLDMLAETYPQLAQTQGSAHD